MRELRRREPARTEVLRDVREPARPHLRLALARKRGDRVWEWRMLIGLVESLYILGEWDEALARFAEIPEEAHVGSMLSSIASTVARIQVDRGNLAEAERVFEPTEAVETVEVQQRAGSEYARAVVRRGERRYAEALAAAEQSLALFRDLHNSASAAEVFAEACEAAFGLGDLDRVDELLVACDQLSPVERTQYLEAHIGRFGARLAAGRGEHGRVDQELSSAVARFGELGMPFWLAVALLEQGEWLAGEGRGSEAEPLLGEARGIFERLRARPWLERVVQAAGQPAEALA